MTRIRWTTGAINQLEGIVKRIQEDNPNAARKVAHTLLDSIANLEAFPTLGDPERMWKEPASCPGTPYDRAHSRKGASHHGDQSTIRQPHHAAARTLRTPQPGGEDFDLTG